MEGRKLCTAFVSRFRANISVTILKKLAARDCEPRFGNELN